MACTDAYGVKFAQSVGAVTAPSIILGLFHETGFDRVAMHIAQFLNPLVVGKDIEVVVAGSQMNSSIRVRENRCFRTWMAVDKGRSSGSVTRRWMWLDMKT